MIVSMVRFGSLLMGWAADQFGAPLVVAIGCGFCASPESSSPASCRAFAWPQTDPSSPWDYS
jgi:hypothetical protein